MGEDRDRRGPAAAVRLGGRAAAAAGCPTNAALPPPSRHILISPAAAVRLLRPVLAVFSPHPRQVIPAMCAGKVMGPGGEAIKALSERTGCSVVVEAKSMNAAFVPFRLVNFLAPGAAQVAAAVAEVTELICQEEKYEASAWAVAFLTPVLWGAGSGARRRGLAQGGGAAPGGVARAPSGPRRRLGCAPCA